ARVLHVPLGELGHERRDVVPADALEDVRADLAGGDIRLQVAGGGAAAGELVPLGLREGGRDDLLVEVLQRRRVGDAGGAGRLGRRGRARGTPSRRGGTAAARRGEARYACERGDTHASSGRMIGHSADNSHRYLRRAISTFL